MIEKFLKDIGLSEKEASVYLALLAVESSNVSELATKTGIKRTTVYPVLDVLIKKGLVNEMKNGTKVEYQAEQPERLETYIEAERIKLNEQHNLLKEVIPRLKSISRDTGERPIIKYYEGREGILESIKEYLHDAKENGEMYLVYPKDLLDETFTETEMKTAKSDRLSKKITTHSIYTSSNGELLKDENSDRIHLTNSKDYPILCDLAVKDDRVRIHTLGKKLSAIYIKNNDLAETLRTLIKLAMKGLRE